MFDTILEWIKVFFSSRERVFRALIILFSAILVLRLFFLQIVEGQAYQENYDLTIEKEQYVKSTRGNIYDRNGELLAYSDLAYSVVIEDTYVNDDDRNKKLNQNIANVIVNIEQYGDQIDNTFGIIIDGAGNYAFSAEEGTSRQRFRADVFGHALIDDLEASNRYGINEITASADEIMNYLVGERRYDIDSQFSKEMQYKICIVRYNLSLNNYQKYISTTIASNVSGETVAYIQENANFLTGISIEQSTVRRYVDAEMFANIIGYTGTISTEEFNERSKEDEDLERTDIIGKAGIEQYLDKELTGKKGKETLYVNNVGSIIKTADKTDPVSGNDVYLSIDKNLQRATYMSLEKEIASILYTKIVNTKTVSNTGSEDDIVIPIYDAYYSLIDNNLINRNKMEAEDATSLQKAIYGSYQLRSNEVIDRLNSQLSPMQGQKTKELGDEYNDYVQFIERFLITNKVILTDSIDQSTDIYKNWIAEEISINEYLVYAIENNWIDINVFLGNEEYVNTSELYDLLVEYIVTNIQNEDGFEKLVYKYLIMDDVVTGNQLCRVLYEQGFFAEDAETLSGLESGSINSYDFIKSKLQSLELTPGQLALDPSTGSAVVLDSNTGEVLACVTYPGYDNNLLSGSVDSEYYNYLNSSGSQPLYNHATQQRTAPGSTFKMVTATAGLAEGTISTGTVIRDEGSFAKVSNNPKCWVYPGSHGELSVSGAIRHSCNYFFYELGYQFAGGDNNYNDPAGIRIIDKYASMYGLDEKTGVEIEETTPKPATEYPVMAAIGQSNNNYTTISLARYVTAVANSGNVYDLTLLDRVTDSTDGSVVQTYAPTLKNQVTVLDSSEWAAIHSGMREVVENLAPFNNIEVEAAGKTGTAQENLRRSNHALFVGYAPYNNPQISLAVRIPHGYASSNAATVASNVFAFYFGEISMEDIEQMQVSSTTTANAVAD